MATSPEQTLRDAVDDFRQILTEGQNAQLTAISDVPDESAVLMFTASLDRMDPKRRGKSVASRCYTLLRSIQQFSGVIDTFVASNPEIAGLVWGSVKCALMILVNLTFYFDAFSKLCLKLGKLVPLYAEYQLLFPSSVRLQSALARFHAAIVRCCKEAIVIGKQPWHGALLSALYTSFHERMRPYLGAVEDLGRDVKYEIQLAKAIADHDDQRLQSEERKDAAFHRKIISVHVLKSLQETASSKEWRVVTDNRRKAKRRQKLLDSLSAYDHVTAFKQFRTRRHQNTAEWVMRTAEWEQWQGQNSGVLILSGKLGSGKTILSASAVDHLLLSREPQQHVAFFFPRFDDIASLQADTILRSLARQLMSFQGIDTVLSDLVVEGEETHWKAASVMAILQQLVSTATATQIVIDALDEIEDSQRRILLRSIDTLLKKPGVSLRVFLACRDGTLQRIRTTLPDAIVLSTVSPLAEEDLSAFTRSFIDEKLGSGELVIGSKALEAEIFESLIAGAGGMILWVCLALQEICRQSCDEDIQLALRNLPRGLTELYNRLLRQVKIRGHQKIATNALRFIVAARRPLTLTELREALSVEVCKPRPQRGRLINNIERLPDWCENLVCLDEEARTVQLVHQSVMQHLTSSGSAICDDAFRFDTEEVNHFLGEIIMTYLSWEEFQMTVAAPHPPGQGTPSLQILPEQIALASLRNNGQKFLATSLLRFGKLNGGRSQRQRMARGWDCTPILSAVATQQHGGEYLPHNHQSTQQSFLNYASSFWLHHTGSFEAKRSQTWHIWLERLDGAHPLTPTPWSTRQFYYARQFSVLPWAMENEHYALVRVVMIILYALDSEDVNGYRRQYPLLRGLAESPALMHYALVEGCFHALRNHSFFEFPRVFKDTIDCRCEHTSRIDSEICRAIRAGGFGDDKEIAQFRLLAAMMSGNADLAKQLLYNDRSLADSRYPCTGSTALVLALELRGRPGSLRPAVLVELCKLLIDEGTDVRHYSKETVLHQIIHHDKKLDVLVPNIISAARRMFDVDSFGDELYTLQKLEGFLLATSDDAKLTAYNMAVVEKRYGLAKQLGEILNKVQAQIKEHELKELEMEGFIPVE